jgi:hypothetical protein
VLALRAVNGTSQSDLDAAIGDIRASVEGGQSLGSLLSFSHGDVMLARMAPPSSGDVCIPKIRFCSNGDEGRRGQAAK